MSDILNSAGDTLRERALASQKAAEGMRVFKYRNLADDAWVYMTATDRKHAAERFREHGRSVPDLYCASRADLEQLAVRALLEIGR